jgi:hypothetical protein
VSVTDYVVDILLTVVMFRARSGRQRRDRDRM